MADGGALTCCCCTSAICCIILAICSMSESSTSCCWAIMAWRLPVDWSCSRGGTSEDRGAWSWTDSASMAMGREEEEPSLDIGKDEWEKQQRRHSVGCRA